MKKTEIMQIKKNFTKKDDLEKINLYSRKPLTQEDVYTFSVKLCDNEIDRDFECFSCNALRELAPLFEGKTGMFDHSMKSADQKARIFETFVKKEEGKTTSYGEPLYSLMARAYMLKNDENSGLIDEIEAGIKKEVSVSCSVKRCICSICQNDSRKKRCSHIPGRRYSGRLCYGILDGAADAYEFSFVAVPAQKTAGVTKAFNIREEANMNDVNEIINKMKDGSGGIELSGKQADELSSYIENLRGEAALSGEYKKALEREVSAMLFKALPDMDREVIASLASVMTFKELKSFKDCLSKRKAVPLPQIGKENKITEKQDFSQFRI